MLRLRTRHPEGMRAVLAVALALAALIAGAPSASAAGNPLAGQRLYMDCESGHIAGARPYSAWWNVYTASGTTRALFEKIAKVPGTKWFAGIDSAANLRRQVERFFAGVDHPAYGGANCSRALTYSSTQWASGPVPLAQRDPYVGALPVVALRAMKHERCRGWNGGPWNSTATHGPYKTWIRAFVDEMRLTHADARPYRYFSSKRAFNVRVYRERRAAVILEPDALGLMGSRSKCLTRAARKRRLAQFRYAVGQLRRLPNVAVYIDAGSSTFMPAAQAVSYLRKAGVAGARGFALNSTHFNSTTAERRYGDRVARALGGKHYVINTAENGRRVSGGVNCNPRQAGLGRTPTSRTGSKYADAFLWLSRPGISSNRGNRCGRGPTTNVWWDAHAASLARKAVFGRAPWPPKPL